MAPLDANAPSEMHEPISILIVDDEPKNLKVLETVLDDPGYRLVCAESGEKALLALVAEEFALLVLDIHMPSHEWLRARPTGQAAKEDSRRANHLSHGLL